MAEKKWDKYESEAAYMMNEFLDYWNTFTTRHKAEYLSIEGADYPLNYLQFTIDTIKCTCTTRVVDAVYQKHSLTKLTAY